MTLDIIFKLKSNPNYIEYLRNNSYWYKMLNRNPSLFKKFEDEVKKAYHIRTTDKISNAINTIELISNVVSNLK